MNTIVIKTASAPGNLLRRSLLVDGVITGAAGLLLALAAGPLGDLFELPVPLLRVVGFGLLPYTAFVLTVATRETISRPAAWTIVGLNVAWATASLLLLVTGWVDPSTLGIVFAISQSLIVAAFADVQYLGLCRSQSQ